MAIINGGKMTKGVNSGMSGVDWGVGVGVTVGFGVEDGEGVDSGGE